MKIIVCDDDKIYANEIKYYVISILDNHNISPDCFVFYESKEVFEQADNFDMAFLDINIKPYTGIEVAKQLRQHRTKTAKFFL